MVQCRVIGGHRKPLPQDVLTGLIPPLRPVEVRQIYIRRHKRGIDPQRRLVFPLGLHGLAELHMQDAQVEVRLRSVGVDLLGLPILCQGTVKCPALLSSRACLVQRRQHPRRLEPHGPDGIPQQGGHQAQPGVGCHSLEHGDSRHADQGVGSRQGLLDGCERLRAQRPAQQRHRRGPRYPWHGRIPEQPHQRPLGPGLAAAPRLQGGRKMRRPRPWPVPARYGLSRPPGRALRVTGSAHVGRPELHREIRPRSAEAVQALARCLPPALAHATCREPGP
jgi:hypothetical protein